MKIKYRLAYGSVPKGCGTYTFYRNISPILLNHGIMMYCVCVGRENALLWEKDHADKNCILIAQETYNVKRQSMKFVEWCLENDIDMVMGINSIPILNSIPYLPKKIRLVSRCANSFDFGYKITLMGAERLHAIFAISKKLEDDLINKYHADSKRVYLIDNGINPTPYKKIKRKFNKNNILKLGFIGRLENNQKGIFHIPKILNELDIIKVPFEMLIVGKGKHEKKLQKLLKKYINSGKVKFIGPVSSQKIPAILKNIDIFIFPSHFEGVGNALLEAMVAGCVCFSWLIKGLTDYVIENNYNGYIHDLADYKTFAKNIKRLNDDRQLLKEISIRASETSIERFSPEKSAKKYAEILIKVMNEKPFDFDVKAWSEFKINDNFIGFAENFFPRSVKKYIKEYLNKLGFLS